MEAGRQRKERRNPKGKRREKRKKKKGGSHRDMNQLNKVTNETHDGESDGDSFTELNVFC